jgi:Na+/H+ antiporter NhaD/arsenite permease-like protein
MPENIPETLQAHAHAHPAPSTGVTLLFAALLVATIVALALEEKIHAKKSMITGIAALITLLLGDAFGLLPMGPVVNVLGEQIALPVYIPAIDWGVIAIIFGASLFVDVMSKSGLFSYIAIKLTKMSEGDPFRLLFYYGLLTVAFSAVLNNVTAMLIVGSLSAVSLRKLGRGDKLMGFLLVEGLLTNVGGLLTLISSVPNIIVGRAAGIAFMKFFLIAGPYVLVATVGTIVVGARAFGIKRLATQEERGKAAAEVASFDERDGIESMSFFWVSVVAFVAFIGVLAATPLIPVIRDLDMGYVALAFAGFALLRYKSTVDRFYAALDWDLLGFFASLFVVINVMEHARVLELIGHGLGAVIGLGPRLGSGALLIASAATSSVTDNIPLAAVLSKILEGMPDKATPGMWWAVIFGANLGGNITPIGSASTVVAATIMHKHKVGVSFGRFVALAVPYAALQIVLAVGYVLLFVG